jgi:hypothetical protein
MAGLSPTTPGSGESIGSWLELAEYLSMAHSLCTGEASDVKEQPAGMPGGRESGDDVCDG